MLPNLLAFEKRNRLSVDGPSPVHVRRTPYLSDEFRAAIDAYNALYAGDSVPQPDGGHLKMIEGWLKEHRPGLSKQARTRIAKVVNPNKKGGAPKS
jgi:hypothetical protein